MIALTLGILSGSVHTILHDVLEIERFQCAGYQIDHKGAKSEASFMRDKLLKKYRDCYNRRLNEIVTDDETCNKFLILSVSNKANRGS